MNKINRKINKKSYWLRQSSKLIGAIAVLFYWIPGVGAAPLTNWLFDPESYQLAFTLPSGTTPKYSLEANPLRLILQLPETEVGTNVTELYPDGLVRRVRLSETGPQQAEVIIDFAPGVVLSESQIELKRAMNNGWQLNLAIDPNITSVANAPSPNSFNMEPVVIQPDTNNQPSFTNGINLPPGSKKTGDDNAILIPRPTNPSVLNNDIPGLDRSIAIINIQTDRDGQVNVPIVNTINSIGDKSPDPVVGDTSLPEAPAMTNTYNVEPPPVNSGLSPSVNYAVPSNTMPSDNQAYIAPANNISNTSLSPQTTPMNPVSITYGQPLPSGSGNIAAASLLVRKGDRLNLIFPREKDMRLPKGVEWQEVMVLQNPIVDQAGNIIVPANTPVIGGFETERKQSRFIARAIYINGRSIPISAQSDWLPGVREINPLTMTGVSTLSGLGLLLITGMSGFGFL
ncbi:MAG: hypothetical protein ACRC2J_06745, partial [Microcoleaceae cyanobacterium]